MVTVHLQLMSHQKKSWKSDATGNLYNFFLNGVFELFIESRSCESLPLHE